MPDYRERKKKLLLPVEQNLAESSDSGANTEEEEESPLTQIMSKEQAKQLTSLSPDEKSELLTEQLRLVLMERIDESVDHTRALVSVGRLKLIRWFILTFGRL